MTEYGPDVQGGGVSTSLNEYVSSVTENFPRISKGRSIESSIAGRNKLDVLPVNNSNDGDGIRDRYVEFRVAGVQGQFLDLSTLTIDLMVSVSSSDGSTLSDTDYVMFVNGLSNTLFKSCTCYFNEQMIESNALFNYHSFIKMITTISKEKMDSIGGASFYYRDYEGAKGIVDTYTEEYFTGGNAFEKTLAKTCKAQGISMTAPLLLDISSLDAYLLDSTDVRIRLELANNSWIMNTHQPGVNLKFKIDSIKLWVDRVVPRLEALNSLNQALSMKALQYTYNRTLYKTYVLGVNQTSLVAELPFTQIIPQNLTMCIVDMASLNGEYSRNGLYFTHADLSHVHITINGSTVYNIRSEFPHHTARLYYSTLEALGLETHNSLTFNAFKEGRTLCAFNFVPENIDNGIPLDKSGNLRVNLTFNKGHTSNLVIMFFAETTGIIEINSHRNVRCIVRA